MKKYLVYVTCSRNKVQ